MNLLDRIEYAEGHMKALMGSNACVIVDEL